MSVPALPAILSAIILLPMSAVAQYRCTMPSGSVIYSHLSPCPKDATLAEKIDRVPDVIPTQPARPRPAPEKPAIAPPVVVQTPPPKPPAPAPIPQAAPREIVTEAYGICALLRMAGATTCEVNVNVFSPSYIDATLPTNPRDAMMTCLTVANQTRQPGSPFVGRGWRLKLFSPMGSGARPMAECIL